MDLQIIVPAGADMSDALAHGLVALTEAIDQIDPDVVAHGFLGGRHGYGGHWDNDVFTMRPFYWGDCDCGYDQREEEWCRTHRHAPDCYQSELRERKIATGMWEVRPDRAFEWWKPDADYKKIRAAEDKIMDDLCAKFGLDREWGAAVHCTCSHQHEWKSWVAENGHTQTCSIVLPNFLHKRTGLEVRWYKYIGRDMEAKNADGVSLQAVFSECLASLPSTSQ